MYRIMILPLILTLSLFAETYLSQESIDSLTQSAYYGFVAATRSAGGQYTQESAIAHAQSVVRELRAKAANDPNRQYILFKVAELEAQISLEKEEVGLKREYARVTSINALVPIFNKELLKRYPSFSKLHSFHSRMLLVDINKSNELATKINQKNRSVSADLRNDVQDAFGRGDYTTVETSYVYAVKNRKYLSIGEREYLGWSKKLQAKRSAENLTIELNMRVAAVEKLVKSNKIDAARRYVFVLRVESEQAAKHLSKSFTSTLKKKLAGLETTVVEREQAMVKHALTLVDDGNLDKATAFLENVMIPAGVDLDCRAEVSRALMGKGVEPRETSEETHASVSAITATTLGMSSEQLRKDMAKRAERLNREFELMSQKAQSHYERHHRDEIKLREKSLAKRASLQLKADAYLVVVADAFASGKPGKAVKKFMKKHEFLRSYATPYTYYDIKIQVNAARGVSNHNDQDLREIEHYFAQQQPEKKQEEAFEHTMEIYSLLESQRVEDAYGHFLAHEMLLEEHGYKEAFLTLKRMVVKAYRKEKEL